MTAYILPLRAAAPQQPLRCVFNGLVRPNHQQTPRFVRSAFCRIGYGGGSAPLHTFQKSSAIQSTSSFTYRIAASYSAKGHRFDPETNVFNFNPYTRIQHTALNSERERGVKRRPASGEDAFFISRVGETGDVAIGIADGVGGWAESGVDPADFAHTFCENMAKAAYEFKDGLSSDNLKPRDLMQAGYQTVVDNASVAAGGSTACVGLARRDGTLEVANLGDSGFVHLRLNAVHYCSEPQTHAFNTPYQLSVIPAKLLAQMATYGGAHIHDSPRDAIVSTHSLRHGDVLVFGSDGVWDNLSAQDTLRIVSQYLIGRGAWESGQTGLKVGRQLKALTGLRDDYEERGTTLQSMLALAIASRAKVASLNTKVDGPFAKEVHRYFPGESYHGGKVDDICVVVVLVLEDGR